MAKKRPPVHPIGLVPRKTWEEQQEQASHQRIKEILDAMQRYADANKAIPAEWVEELKTHIMENLII